MKNSCLCHTRVCIRHDAMFAMFSTMSLRPVRSITKRAEPQSFFHHVAAVHYPIHHVVSDSSPEVLVRRNSSAWRQRSAYRSNLPRSSGATFSILPFHSPKSHKKKITSLVRRGGIDANYRELKDTIWAASAGLLQGPKKETKITDNLAANLSDNMKITCH